MSEERIDNIETMDQVIQQYLKDTLAVSLESDGYLDQHEQAYNYCKLLADMKKEEERLHWEIAKTEAQAAEDKRRYEEEKAAKEAREKLEFEKWVKENASNNAYMEARIANDAEANKQKSRSNTIGLITGIGTIAVGIGSVLGGIYLGKKGLETDREGYNESPGTLKQAESIVGSSTRYV